MWIDIISIKVNAKQLKKLDRHKVDQHRKAFEQGEDPMPIDVVKINENEYCICGNGRHRYFGAKAAGMRFIDVNIINLEG